MRRVTAVMGITLALACQKQEPKSAAHAPTGPGGMPGPAAATQQRVGSTSFHYLEQGAADRASQLLAKASKDARSQEEKRQLAHARRRVLERSGKTDEVKSLYAQWKQSDDQCLRADALRREKMVAAGPGMPAPMPPPTR